MIGGGDWAADRLLPDAVRAWSTGQQLTIRHPGHAPLAARDRAAGRLPVPGRAAVGRPAHAGAYNFGPLSHGATVGYVVKWPLALIQKALPATKIIVKARTKAAGSRWKPPRPQALGVAPAGDSTTAVERTMAWYRAQQGRGPMPVLCAWPTWMPGRPPHECRFACTPCPWRSGARAAPALQDARGLFERMFCADDWPPGWTQPSPRSTTV